MSPEWTIRKVEKQIELLSKRLFDENEEDSASEDGSFGDNCVGAVGQLVNLEDRFNAFIHKSPSPKLVNDHDFSLVINKELD